MRSRIRLLAFMATFAASAAAARSHSLPTAAPMAQATVHIANFAFVPATLVVGAGQAVRFVNDDAEGHTVTARDASFDSTGLDTHETWQHTFARVGTYRYFCQLHPMMTGTIVVRAAEQRP